MEMEVMLCYVNRNKHGGYCIPSTTVSQARLTTRFSRRTIKGLPLADKPRSPAEGSVLLRKQDIKTLLKKVGRRSSPEDTVRSFTEHTKEFFNKKDGKSKIQGDGTFQKEKLLTAKNKSHLDDKIKLHGVKHKEGGHEEVEDVIDRKHLNQLKPISKK